jgi:hypothetical protein
MKNRANPYRHTMASISNSKDTVGQITFLCPTCWTLSIGIKHDYNTHTILLSQEAYIDNLVEHFGLQNATTVTTLLDPGVVFTKDQCLRTPEELQDMSRNNYQELIRSLQYIALVTQPDISFAISKLAQFLTNPRHIHLEAATHVLQYLKGMKSWNLNLGGDVTDVAGFMDSDWGGDHDDQKSISAYVFKMGDCAILCKMKKQSSIALSSVEVEYMVMCQAVKEAIWLTGLLEDFGIDLQTPLIIFGDNQGALALAQNPIFTHDRNISPSSTTSSANLSKRDKLLSSIFQ